MKLHEIYTFLNEKAPFELAESWDNCGVLLGQDDNEISKIILSLDISFEIIQNAPQNSLIITHHPFLFSSIKKIDTSSQSGRIIKEAIKKDISIIAMHTNYDKAVLNSFFTRSVLGLECESDGQFVCNATVNMKFDALLELVKSKLNLQNLNYVKPAKSIINSIGITTGSGGEFALKSGVDVYLTGDIKYHTAFDATELGVGLIDITHYASELCFGDSMAEILNILPIEVIITNSKNPIEQY
jgi:dinuclear metal center YbgI/SA1388 family protein